MNSDKPLWPTHAVVLVGVGGVDSIMRANSKKINDHSDAQHTSRRIVDSEIKCPRQETSALKKMLRFGQESRKYTG